MRIHILAITTCGLLAGCHANKTTESAESTGREPTPAEVAGFERLKALEGTWETTGRDGRKNTFVFHVTAGGSAVREIMFAGTDHEMTNMYTLDRSRGGIGLVHYCGIGNQPQLCATTIDANRLDFDFVRVHNAASADQMYMGEMTMTFVDNDHIREEWDSLQNGRVERHAKLELSRKK